MREYIKLTVNYNGLQKGVRYKISQEGKDWYAVKNQGSLKYVFKSYCE